MSGFSADVAGGGIAGLTAGLALARLGWSVTIHERNERPGEVGAGIQLGPNATRILQRLGLGDRLGAIGIKPIALQVRRFADGKLLADARFSSLSQRFGAPYLTVKRADLHGVLFQAAQEAGVDIRFGSPCSEGKALAAHDLLIGADGLHSALRRHIAPRSQPLFTGKEAWRAMIVMPEPAGDPVVTLWLGKGKHCVTYPVGAQGERMLNLVFVQQAQAPRTGWSNPGSGASAEKVFSDACPELAACVRAVKDWRVWSLFDMDPAGSAGEKSILIGDAAHPVLPFLAQGAGLAIEDAGLLSDMLRLTGGALSMECLQVFAKARQIRAGRLRAAAARNGQIYHMTGLSGIARDLAIRALGGGGLLTSYDWLYGFDSEKEAKALIGLAKPQ